MSEGNETLSALLAYVQAEGRVCPQPDQWNALYQLLPNRRQRTDGSWEPALPLILAAWWDTPHLAKMLRLREHIEYAAAHGVLDMVDRYLRKLPPDSWHCSTKK